LPGLRLRRTPSRGERNGRPRQRHPRAVPGGAPHSSHPDRPPNCSSQSAST
jgi:hypothetical protein